MVSSRVTVEAKVLVRLCRSNVGESWYKEKRALAVPNGLVHHLVGKSCCAASASIGDEQNVSAFLKSFLGELFPPKKSRDQWVGRGKKHPKHWVLASPAHAPVPQVGSHCPRPVHYADERGQRYRTWLHQWSISCLDMPGLPQYAQEESLQSPAAFGSLWASKRALSEFWKTCMFTFSSTIW